MLQLRRILALMLTCAYLLAAGASSWASLCCPCIELHRHTEQCCHGCHHAAETSSQATLQNPVGPAEAHFEGLCCDDRHSNERALYTNGEEDSTRRQGRAATQQPVDGVVAESLRTASPEVPDGVALLEPRNAPPVAGGCAGTHALRAPPVTA